MRRKDKYKQLIQDNLEKRQDRSNSFATLWSKALEQHEQNLVNQKNRLWNHLLPGPIAFGFGLLVVSLFTWKMLTRVKPASEQVPVVAELLIKTPEDFVNISQQLSYGDYEHAHWNVVESWDSGNEAHLEYKNDIPHYLEPTYRPNFNYGG